MRGDSPEGSEFEDTSVSDIDELQAKELPVDTLIASESPAAEIDCPVSSRSVGSEPGGWREVDSESGERIFGFSSRENELYSCISSSSSSSSASADISGWP